MNINAVKEYKIRLVGMLTDKTYEIAEAISEGSNDKYITSKRKEEKALEYAINLIDREILESDTE